jgi:ketosteroid isomerase-like protein
MTILEELASFNKEFAVGLEQNDSERVADLYTKDAVFLSQGADTVHGQENIRELLLRMPSSPERISFETREVFEDGDLVVDTGTLLVGGVGFGKYVVIHRRQADGTLKIAVDVPLSDH